MWHHLYGICCRGNIVTTDPTILHLHLPQEEYFGFIWSDWMCWNSQLIVFILNPDMSPLAYLDEWAVWWLLLDQHLGVVMGVTPCCRFEPLRLRRTEAAITGFEPSLDGEDDWVWFLVGLGICECFTELRLLKGGKERWSPSKTTILYIQLCTSQRELFAFLIDNFTISHNAVSQFHDSLQEFSFMQFLPVDHVPHVPP
jgi:hypothetical protein